MIIACCRWEGNKSQNEKGRRVNHGNNGGNDHYDTISNVSEDDQSTTSYGQILAPDY
jgi:hypothetical protein